MPACLHGYIKRYIYTYIHIHIYIYIYIYIYRAICGFNVVVVVIVDVATVMAITAAIPIAKAVWMVVAIPYARVCQVLKPCGVPWRPVVSRGVPWSAMKDPSPFLIFTARNGASVWASGIFKGSWQWQRAHNIGCRANCLREPNHDAIECHVNIDDRHGLEGRKSDAVERVLCIVIAIVGGEGEGRR